MSKTKPQEKGLDVTYTLGQIPGVFSALGTIGDVPLDARLSYRLKKVMVPIQDAMKRFMGVRDALIKKYGAPIEGKKDQFQVDPAGENFDEYQAELKELLDEEVVVSTRPVLLPPEAQVPAIALNTLDDFVGVKGEDDEEEPAAGPTEVVREK
jgi:hypothetical protein